MGGCEVGVANGPASEIDGVDIDAAVPSLDGPARVAGQFSGPDGAPVVFRLASQKPGPDGTPIRVEVDAGPSWPAGEFEGMLEGEAAGALTGLRLAGTAALTGTAPGENEPTPWRVAGPMTVDFARAVLRGAEFRLGPEERAIRATGDATLAFGSPPRLGIDLKAKQANVDALMRRKGEDGVAPARAVTLLSRIAAAALEGRQGRIAIDARASAEPIILGAQTLPDATVALRAEPGSPLHLRFNLGLPGQSRIAGEGDLDAGAAAKFRGDIDFSSPDFGLLRDWASLGAPESAAKVAAFGEALAYRSAALKGEVEASATRLSGRNLKLTLDRTTLTGSLAFASPAGGEAGRLDLDLATDSLDVDTLPSLAAAKMIGDMDFSISLEAALAAYRPRRRNGGRQRPRGAEDYQERARRHARALERRRTRRRLARHHRRDGSRLDCGERPFAGRAGARFRHPGFAPCAGRMEPDAGRSGGRALAGCAGLRRSWRRRRRAGHRFVARQRIGGRNPVHDCARSAVEGPVAAPWPSTSIPQTRARCCGSSACARRPREAGAGISRSMRPGGWAQGYDVDATSSVAGAELTWRGRFLPAAEGGDAKLFGAAKVKAPNLAPVAVALGLAPANGGAFGPADIGFDATLRGDKWTFSKLAATIAGVKASGELTYQPVATLAAAPRGERRDLRRRGGAWPRDGSRAAATVSAGGDPRRARRRTPADGRHSGARAWAAPAGQGGNALVRCEIRPPPLRPPSTAIKLKVGTLDLTDALSAQGFAAMLRFDKGRLDLDDLKMQIARGGASGQRDAPSRRRHGDADRVAQPSTRSRSNGRDSRAASGECSTSPRPGAVPRR